MLDKSRFGDGLSLYDGSLNILRGTVDPTENSGVPAPITSVFARSTDGTAKLYLKTGPADTDWQLISTDNQNNARVVSTSVNGVTSQVTADQVLVDESRLVEWSVIATSTADDSDRTSFTVLAIHDGNETTDAANVTWSQVNTINIGNGVNGITPTVDLNGLGASQNMRLRISSTQECNVEIMRQTLSWASGEPSGYGGNAAIGAQGPQGPANGGGGGTGVQGFQGLIGATGSAGSAGSAGVQGFQGLIGATGSAGSAGSAGVQGFQGLVGATGSAGSAGSAGVQGFQGLIGATGSAGSAGSAGVQGFQGLIGLVGATGSAGFQGFQGLIGATGSDASIPSATLSEVNTGTETSKYVSPDTLAGSYAGKKTVVATLFDVDSDVTTGNNKGYFVVPASMNGMNLTDVHAEVATAGTGGVTTLQVHNATDAVNMLSTAVNIDASETGSDTAATAAVVDTSNDDVATYDVIRFDISAVSTTAPKGLVVTTTYQLP